VAAIIGLSVCAQQATKVASPPPEPPAADTGKAVTGGVAKSLRKVVPLPVEKPDPPETTNPLAKEQENTETILQNLSRLRNKIGPPLHQQGPPILETDTNYVPP
jgi:hypothetical protein